MITVTDKAARKAVLLAEKKGVAKVLRLGVRGGGCSGYSYSLEFDDSNRDGDHIMEVGDLTVRVDPKSLKLLDGMELDYDTNLLRGGFRFNNPNARRSCGCGESFSV